MHRQTLGLLVLLALIVSTIAVLLLLSHRRRLPKTFTWPARVVTVAGDGSPVYRDATQPRQGGFADPFGIAIGPDGVVYVSDAGESNRIRKLAPDGTLTSLAGGIEGYADGAGSEASFNTPSGLAVDASGNVFVADTSNNRIRKITPQGVVSTVAGDGTAGYADGPAAISRFDGPMGIAVDSHGDIYVADTYNDRIRKISVDAQVTTIAGAGHPGLSDGDGNIASFDTPCSVAVSTDGSLIVADTGNNRLRKVSQDGQVTTLAISLTGAGDSPNLRKPVGLALTRDGVLYVTEMEQARIVQITSDGSARVISGGRRGFADGSERARFNQPTGIAVHPITGELFVTDSANYLVRKLSSATVSGPAIEPMSDASASELIPRITSDTLGQQSLLWPLDPQDRAHEVVATMGEVRGSFDSTDSRDHLHSGLDVFGGYGDVVRAIRSEKVTSPLANWGFGSLSEGLRVGVISYIHMQVGRDKDGKVFSDNRFSPVKVNDSKLTRIRIKRGTRFRAGDAIGTVNRMYHIHLIVGPPGGEINPLSLSPVGFIDHIAPTIQKDGIQLYDETGHRLTEKQLDRVLVHGRVRVVVEAFDRSDLNAERRRLGLYRIGYQLLSGTESSRLIPAPGFEQPRMNIVFNRLPDEPEAPKIAYAEQSGITVYGSETTKFLYEVTNTVRDGRATRGFWDTSELPAGDYVLRVIAADYSGNEAQQGRDVPVRVQ